MGTIKGKQPPEGFEMFKIGDKVECKRNPGFWYTITAVLPHGFYRCKFGAIGGDAGSFRGSELVTYDAGF
jgi:uncharacterized protein YodC (DUF2158 family)